MLLTFFSLAALSLQVVCTSAQVVVNGQIFTNGLAIIDSPAPSSTLHAGSTTSVAIDVSGDGKLTPDAEAPSSTQSTHYDLLEVYLTSPEVNLTVSQGPGLLQQEQGSTVKHINWVIDTCIKSGNYNLTVYETSHIQDQPYFTITPLPISIENSNPTSSCTAQSNSVQPLPQTQSSLATSPWLDGSQTSIVPYPSATASNAFRGVACLWEGLVVAVGVVYLTYWV
ncbi:hypothetical protein EIP91_006475 [Steccherinum ochraceum]|uniref:Uncharacterized protein n=1 Tax=Steccherinum ochraceum TaxID=92696 RepID=A0A4R0RZ45_9APHY|nr:hypothetical protein EIP91_006475 [Steccherinum ochraceum]